MRVADGGDARSPASDWLRCMAPPPVTRKTLRDAEIGDELENVVGKLHICSYRKRSPRFAP